MIKTDRPVSKESDSFGLRFDSHDDALNYARKVVKDTENWLAVNKLNIAESYEKGVIIIHCVLGIDGCLDQYHLVFGAVPSRWIREPNVSLALPFDCRAVIRHCYGADESVFIGVTKLVQSPEKIIPSFVWLERAYQVRNFLREFSATTVEGRFVSGGISNREESVVSANSSQRSDGTDRLIESRPEIINSVDDMAVERQWHRFSQFELEELVSAVIVQIGNSGVSVGLKEGIHFPFKLGKVILCPCDAVL